MGRARAGHGAGGRRHADHGLRYPFVVRRIGQFRLEDPGFLSALVDKGASTPTAQMHAAILLAGQPAEAFR